jgi:hypothetical protein
MVEKYDWRSHAPSHGRAYHPQRTEIEKEQSFLRRYRAKKRMEGFAKGVLNVHLPEAAKKMYQKAINAYKKRNK